MVGLNNKNYLAEERKLTRRGLPGYEREREALASPSYPSCAPFLAVAATFSTS